MYVVSESSGVSLTIKFVFMGCPEIVKSSSIPSASNINCPETGFAPELESIWTSTSKPGGYALNGQSNVKLFPGLDSSLYAFNFKS